MAAAVLGVRVLLAAVLLVAGVGKLADRAGTRRSLRDFGAPEITVPAVAVLLPVAEIAMAIALLPAATATWAAAAAAVLLALFAAGIARVLRSGQRPDCHCFGAMHSRPVTARTLARTGALALLAAGAAVAGTEQLSAVRWLGELSFIELLALLEGIALLALAAGAVWLGMHLLRQNGRLLVRLDGVERAVGLFPGDGAGAPEGLPVGAPAPAFALPLRGGGQRALEDLGERVLLVFADAGCGPCRSLFAEIGDWHAGGSTLEVAIVLSGDAAAADGVPPDIPVLLAGGRDLQEQYAVFGTPTAVLVREGRIASDTAPGAGAIRRLAAEAARPALVVEQVGSRARPVEATA